MKRIGCDSTECKGSEGASERHSVDGGKQDQIGERKQSKLEMTGRLMESECKARCVWIDCKRHDDQVETYVGQQNWQWRWEGGMEWEEKIGCVSNVEMGR